jgi:hypothetical protein
MWTAVEEGMVLVLPATAVADAWPRLDEGGRAMLEMLLRLPVAVVGALNLNRARLVGEQGGDCHAHAVVCASDRGWPLVTADTVGRRPPPVIWLLRHLCVRSVARRHWRRCTPTSTSSGSTTS